MSKLKEIRDYYVPPTCQVDSHTTMMKEYAEWYATQCVERLFGGICKVDSNNITHISFDNQLKLKVDKPKHD